YRRSDISVQGLQFTQCAGFEQFLAEYEVCSVAALAACLVKAIVAPESGRQRPSLLDGHRARFLAINVLAMLRGDDSQGGMPSVSRRHQYGVDILARQQGILIVIQLAAAIAILRIDCRLDLLPPGIADIAHGDKARPWDV